MKTLDAKQMTVWIDGDVYQAMLLTEAKGGGSLKEQINSALRQSLGVTDVSVLERQERAAYAEKPWGEDDETELRAWESVQSWDDE